MTQRNCHFDELDDSSLYAVNISKDREPWLILVVLVLLYVFRAIAVVTHKIMVPAFSVLGSKLNIGQTFGKAIWNHIPHSFPFFWVSYISLAQSDPNDLFKSRQVFSSTSVGLLFGSLLFKTMLIPALAIIKNGFNAILLKKNTEHEYIQLYWPDVTRDLLFQSIALILYVKMFLTDIEPEIQLSESHISEMCLVGDEATCCFQDNVGEDEYTRSATNVITRTEVSGIFTLFIFYLFTLLMHNKIKLIIEIFSSQQSKISKLDILLQGSDKTIHHQFQSFESDNMLDLSVYFVTRCRFPATEMFELIDVDGNGTLDHLEFIKMFRVFGLNISENTSLDLIKYISDYQLQDARIQLNTFRDWFIFTEATLINERKKLFQQVHNKSTALFLMNMSMAKYGLSRSALLPRKMWQLLKLQNPLDDKSCMLLYRSCFLFDKLKDSLIRNTADSFGSLQSSLDFGAYVDGFVHDLELYDKNAVHKKANLMYSARETLVSKEATQGFIVLPYSSAFAYEKIYTAPCFTFYLDFLKRGVDIPILSLFSALVTNFTGKLVSLSAAGALLWIVVGFLIIGMLSLLLVFLVETIGLSLSIPFDLLSFTLVAGALNLFSLMEVLNLGEKQQTMYELRNSLSRIYSSGVFDLLVTFPLSFYLILVTHSPFQLVFESHSAPVTIPLVLLASLLTSISLFLNDFVVGVTQGVLQGFFLFTVACCYIINVDWDEQRGVSRMLVCDSCMDDVICSFEN